MIVLDASAAIELFLDHPSAREIAKDLARNDPILVPDHFEADAYAGLRRMLNTGQIDRAELKSAVAILAETTADRIPLAPLLSRALDLLDRIGAHDVFYVVLAQLRDAPLITADRPLARAAEALGVEVIYHASES